MAQPKVLQVEMTDKQCPVEKKTFFCSLCTYSSDYRTNVKIHTNKVHNMTMTNLECCNICFADKAALQKHLGESHIQRYQCEICYLAFYNATVLRRHEASCRRLRKLACTSCNFTTFKQETIQKHKLMVHQIEESQDLKPSSVPPTSKFLKQKSPSSLKVLCKTKLYKCTKCSFKTKWPNSFSRHISLSRHEVIYNCCGSRFTNKKALQQHKLTEHAKGFKCSTCAQIFNSHLLLRSHQITHSDQKTFKCDFCDYSSLWRSNLKKHLSSKHEANSSSLSLAGQLDQNNHLRISTNSSNEGDVPSEKEVAKKNSKKDEVTSEDHLNSTEWKQDSSKRKSGGSNKGKENLDVSEIYDTSKNFVSLDFTRDFVEQQLKLRCKNMKKGQINGKYRNQSPSLGERPFVKSSSHNNPGSGMAEMLSTYSDASLHLFYSDSDEEANESSSQTSQVMNKSEPLQSDCKGNKKENLLEKPAIFNCPLCSHSTKWRKSLKVHMKIHERQGVDCTPLKLYLNQTSQPRISPLKQAKIITCPLCPFSTKWPGNLKQHVFKIHGLINRFKCTTCPKEFDSSYVLQQHLNTVHSDNRLFRCSICEFTTSRKGYLKLHVTQKHKIEDRHSLTLLLEEPNPENSTSDPVIAVRRSSRLATEQAQPSMDASNSQPLSSGSTLVINSIHEEARQLRAQISQTVTISAVLPLLQRLLEMGCSLTKLIRETTEIEARSQTIESFEYVWNTSKLAVVHWEDLKGLKNHDSSLNAVMYAYGALPLFNDWKKSDHLKMLENATFLILNTVKNLQSQPSNESEFRFSGNLSFQRTMNAQCLSSVPCEPTSTGQVKKGKSAPRAVGAMTKANVSAVDTSKDSNLAQLEEFCRLANISTWQNTKYRSRKGFKDDNGDYHAMYRIGIGKMLSLHCPPDVTHLKCCGKVFDLLELKDHVSDHHEAGRPNRTEPSISPV